MKASLKFREEKKPLFRAKVPLNIVGLPFQSGIVAGESKELTLNLSTFFESGPSIKIAYRPNDSWNPFSLIVKTGTGHFGSPVSSSLLMSAEFNLLTNGNPTFMLHFKPRLGDFSIKKTQSSVFNKAVRQRNEAGPMEDPSIEVVDPPNANGSMFSPVKKRMATFSVSSANLAGVFSGVEMAARTALPVMGRSVVNLRWGVRVPADTKMGLEDSTAGISLRKIPFLVMGKVKLEHVERGQSKDSVAVTTGKVGPEMELAEACVGVRRQVEVLQAENRWLRKAVEELRQDIGGWKTDRKWRENATAKPPSGVKVERKSTEGDGNEEAKKAIKNS